MPSQVFHTKYTKFLQMEFYMSAHMSCMCYHDILIIFFISNITLLIIFFCYSLGHFEFKILFLLRCFYKNYSRGVAKSRGVVARSFQGPPVSVITACLSPRHRNCPRGPQRTTCARVKTTLQDQCLGMRT